MYVVNALQLCMQGILEKDIICGKLHQKMQKCSYNLPKMKVILFLRPQFPQRRGTTVMLHLDIVCMVESHVHIGTQEP